MGKFWAGLFIQPREEKKSVSENGGWGNIIASNYPHNACIEMSEVAY